MIVSKSKFHICIIICVFLNISILAQNKISIRKNTCCDSLFLRIGAATYADTISYSKLDSIYGLGVGFRNCLYDATASIVSFELVSNQRRELIKGNSYNFKKLIHLKDGGDFLIENCLVKCKNYLNEVNLVTLPARKIIVLPVE